MVTFEELWTSESVKKCVAAVTLAFRDKLTTDELNECGLFGLWKTMDWHQEGCGQKFSTSLSHAVKWECLSLISKKKREMFLIGEFDTEAAERQYREQVRQEDNLDHILCRMSRLNQDQRIVIEQYYLAGMSLEQISKANGYSKQTAWKRLGQAEAKLREVCFETV